MSSAPETERRRNTPQPMFDALTAGAPSSWRGNDASASLPVSQHFLSQCLVAGDTGQVGVVMCVLPADISLRAYAIAAVKSVASRLGLAVLKRREVPVQPGATGDDLADLPHIEQFFVRQLEHVDANGYEDALQRLRGAIECRMISMGLTEEDFRIVSCSSREVVYAMPGNSGDPMTFFPDLIDAQLDSGQVVDCRRVLTGA